MGTNLYGEDAKIWGLHNQGFCVTRISGLVGLHESYVRSLICAVWQDDKLDGKRSCKR